MKTMSRIERLFSEYKAFIAYLTAGDGGMQHTLDAAMALIDGGVNMLEIGMPFSDPTADGPVIQRAAMRSLANGTTLQDILWLTEEIRKRSDIPLILFSYLNPILSKLESTFLNDAKHAGIDGLLLVDCPLEESGLIREQCINNEIDLISILTPATTTDRMKKMNEYAQGFLYYACRKGTTGVKNALPEDFEEKIKSIKDTMPLPVVVGFGISNSEMANDVLACADGVVVGSLFVDALEKGMSFSALSTLARNIFPRPVKIDSVV
ncbi:MAG TPA: tryptophan synthase subunit alpha [Gammaproteobacteria bacterium]|jgi:tryptophan synthase alpha chain|nr:tryptophan synthase subunit alpha [Gammaproteobacteria bacterium]